ncbi:MAG: iron-sulfur cluster assembly scaffold protein [Pseudomonadota bacterium]
MDQDLMQLYSTRILALTTQIPHLERLATPMGTHRARSPQCGSVVAVDVVIKDGRIAAFGQDVKACALGQAAAAVVGANAIGRTLPELIQARDALRTMLQTQGPAPSAPFDGLDVLRAAAPFKNRHASILLALDATIGAVEDAAAQAA